MAQRLPLAVASFATGTLWAATGAVYGFAGDLAFRPNGGFIATVAIVAGFLLTGLGLVQHRAHDEERRGPLVLLALLGGIGAAVNLIGLVLRGWGGYDIPEPLNLVGGGMGSALCALAVAERLAAQRRGEFGASRFLFTPVDDRGPSLQADPFFATIVLLLCAAMGLAALALLTRLGFEMEHPEVRASLSGPEFVELGLAAIAGSFVVGLTLLAAARTRVRGNGPAVAAVALLALGAVVGGFSGSVARGDVGEGAAISRKLAESCSPPLAGRAPLEGERLRPEEVAALRAQQRCSARARNLAPWSGTFWTLWGLMLALVVGAGAAAGTAVSARQDKGSAGRIQH